MIEVNQVNHAIGKKQILKNISFKALPAELLAIIGPNGAGKSSLLKLISKEYSCQDGCIAIHGKGLQDYSIQSLSRFRAVLPQSIFLSANLRVIDIVMMGRYPHFDHHPTRNDQIIVEEVLDEMGLLKDKDRLIFTLSGGEQQRVQLARILAQIHGQHNGILLMDEPINGLDLHYQQIILDKAKLMAKLGMTVICILHDINLAAQYAQKILLLEHGQMKKWGTPEEVLTENNIINIYQTKVKRINDSGLGYPGILPIN